MSRYLGAGPLARASRLSHQSPLAIYYAKCPTQSDFSATNRGAMTGEVLWLTNRGGAAEHTVPRAMRAADHAHSPAEPAAATAPPRSFCATESLNTTVRALPPGARQWDSQ